MSIEKIIEFEFIEIKTSWVADTGKKGKVISLLGRMKWGSK